MGSFFDVRCRYIGEKSQIMITFSKDWKDVFSFYYEIGKDRSAEAARAVDNFQIHLNDNKVGYNKGDLDSLRGKVETKVEECLKASAQEDDGAFFRKNASLDSLRNNNCEFSFNDINKIISSVRNGTTRLVPDGKSAPKSLSFINGDGERCYARIDAINIYSIEQIDKILEAEYGRSNFICGFRDSESKRIVVIVLGYMDTSKRPPELKYYQFENVEPLNADAGLVYLYDMNESKVEIHTNCDFADILMPYHDYYSLCLQELEGKNDNQKMTVDLDFLHDYFIEIDSLTVDQGSLLIPVRGKAFKIKEVQIDCTVNKKTEQYSFNGGEIHLPDEKETDEIHKQLREQDIRVPSNISFVRFNYSELGDKDQRIIESLIASGKYDKIQLCYNILGEKARIRRVIEGIEKCLLGQVTNHRLVDLICSNNTKEIIGNIISSKTYKQDANYTSELKKKYWTLRENEEQISAIDKIVQMDRNNVDLMLVQGPPGTGKTELILSLIKELYHLNKKVLVTSNVHVACDNIVDRLVNFRNIALKRYSTIKGDKYNREILENEQKYIKNQVLAGFSVYLDNRKPVNIVLDSKEAYDELKKIKNGFDENVVRIEREKQQYLDSLKGYDKLKADRLSIGSSLDALLQAIEETKNVYTQALDRNKKLESYCSHLEEIVKDKKEKNEILRSQNEKDRQKIKEIERIIESESDEKRELIEKKNKLESDLSGITAVCATSNSRLAYCQSLRECIKSFNGSQALKQWIDYIVKGRLVADATDARLLDVLSPEIVPIIDSIKYIRDVVSKDISFLQEGSYLLNSSFDSVYYKLIADNTCFDIFDDRFYDALKEVKRFYSASALKRTIASVFSFVKINGRSYQSYQSEMALFNDELKKLYYSFDSVIKGVIDRHFSEQTIDIKTAEINREIDELSDSIEKSGNQIKKMKDDFAQIEGFLAAVSKEIEDRSKELDKTISVWEKNSEKYNADHVSYLTMVKEKDEVVEKLNDSTRNLQKKSQEIENLQIEYENERNNLLEIENQINAFEEENRTLIDEFESFMQAKETAKKRCKKDIESIQSVVDAFDKRIQTFVEAGWTKDESEEMLFGYVAELEKISEAHLDKDPDELRRMLDGHGTAFGRMFELTDTGKGSVISMTTNQVAALLHETTNDELTFDYAIIDEASKCTFEDVVISLPRVKHLILIGDFMQLDKLYEKYDQIELPYRTILSRSLWDSLNSSTFFQCLSAAVNYNETLGLDSFDENPMVSVMKKQYRMNKGIFELVKPIYEIHKEFELVDEKQSTFNDVLCLQIDGDEEQDDNKSSSNLNEGLAAVSILKEIADHRDTYPGIKKIGVITGYRAQERLIRKKLEGQQKIAGLEIGTFDRFQGREYDLVLMSLVRTKRLGFTKDIRRMNVAVSRAKNHLIILGNFDKLVNAAKRELNADKREEIEPGDDTNTNKAELEFVTTRLIPDLDSIKKKYPSEELMKSAVIKFLKEEDYSE